jgi:hypothetical protein
MGNNSSAEREFAGTATNAMLSGWRTLLLDAAGGDATLAALTSARLLRFDEDAPTSDETQVLIERFFELDSDQAAGVMARLEAETARINPPAGRVEIQDDRTAMRRTPSPRFLKPRRAPHLCRAAS